MQAPRPTVLVVNAAARQGDAAEAAIRAALRERGVALDDARVVPDPAALGDALRAAVALRPARLLVAGGDGTLSAAADLLAGSGVALGVLPLGTGNDFARNLRIPRDLARACAVVADGQPRRVTVGRVNGRVFLNAVSFGLSSAISRRLTPELKRRAGPLAYPLAALVEALAPEPFRVRIEAPDGARTIHALQVVVGNGRYHGAGTLVAPGATIDDGLLDVYAVEAPGPSRDVADRLRNVARLARVGLLLRRGRHVEHPAVHHVRVRHIRLEAQPPQDADADGELAGRTPVRCDVEPRKLLVLAPPAVPGAMSR